MATAKTTAFQGYLSSVDASVEAREWAGKRTARQAWNECERADWLMWWAEKAGVDRKVLVRLACQFARTALQYVKPGELRPLKTIETAEAWCNGKATIAEVRKAAAAAYAAYAAAASYAAYSAAYAAYSAAYAAASAAYAAASAVYAAASAAYAYPRKWSETRAAKLREFADIVRATIEFPGTKRAK